MSVNDNGTMKDVGMIIGDTDTKAEAVKEAAVEKIMNQLPTDYTELNEKISRQWRSQKGCDHFANVDKMKRMTFL